VHDVADVKTEDPVIVAKVFHTKGTARGDLELLLDLQLVHLFVGLERDLEFLFLGHAVLEEVPSVFEAELADRAELFLYAYQLMDDIMCLTDLFLEDFDPFWDVLAAASIRGGRAIATAFRDASLARPAQRLLHA